MFSGINEAIRLYEAGLTQTEVAQKLGTTQKVIWRAFKNAGYESRVAKKRNQFGENNDSWRADKAGYAALHYRVEKTRGKPLCCEVCETTNAKRYEWANINGNYADIDDYVRMCKSCHASFDGNINNIRKGAIL
jgi:hypothetical protein